MRRFQCTSPVAAIRMTPPSSLPQTLVRPNPRINNMPRCKRNAITSRPLIPWIELPHIRRDSLPAKATDIRGIDTSGHQFFSRRQLFGKLPTLLSCKYFTVTFIPEAHVICDVRKSNVAYTFTNYGGPNLNDQNLQKCFTAYSGKYKALTFFKTAHSPMGTAVSRSKFRKLVKRALYTALHDVVPNVPVEVGKIAGIFHFRFQRYPAGTEKSKLRKDVTGAVKKLYTNDALRRTLLNISRQQSQTYPNVRMLARDTKVENMLGADTVPGYYPKLPFLPRAAYTRRRSKE